MTVVRASRSAWDRVEVARSGVGTGLESIRSNQRGEPMEKEATEPGYPRGRPASHNGKICPLEMLKPDEVGALLVQCSKALRTVIEDAVMDVFELTQSGIIDQLDLAHPIFEPTAYPGHFGRMPDEAGPGTFTWERTDRIDDLRSATDAE